MLVPYIYGARTLWLQYTNLTNPQCTCPIMRCFVTELCTCAHFCYKIVHSSICAWTNGWANNQDAGDLRRHGAHCDVTVMTMISVSMCKAQSGYVNIKKSVKNIIATTRINRCSFIVYLFIYVVIYLCSYLFIFNVCLWLLILHCIFVLYSWFYHVLIIWWRSLATFI